MVLLALVGACAVVAWLADRSVWAAATGSGLVVLSWGLERAAARIGASGSFAHALAVGLGGMVLRVGLVLAALVAVGLLARSAFVETALAFIVSYTAYTFARLWRHPAVPASH